MAVEGTSPPYIEKIIVCRDRNILSMEQLRDADIVIEVSSFHEGVGTIVKHRQANGSLEVIGR